MSTYPHRDIKPSNILLQKDTTQTERSWQDIDVKDVTVKLGDFGCSRDIPSASETVTMSVKGTMKFMAPEIKDAVMKGRTEARCSSKADIFSAALCILALLTDNIEGN